MTWEEKLAALNALSDNVTGASLRMRKPGDWYVEQNVEVKDGLILEGRYGNGATPEAAVLDHWENLTKLKSHEYLVVGWGKERKAYRWNGHMWATVKEKL